MDLWFWNNGHCEWQTPFLPTAQSFCLFPRVHENTELPLCSHSEGKHRVPPHARFNSGSTLSTVARLISPRFTLLWSPQFTYSLCIRCIMHEDYTGLWSRCVTLQSVCTPMCSGATANVGTGKGKVHIRSLFPFFFLQTLRRQWENVCPMLYCVSPSETVCSDLTFLNVKHKTVMQKSSHVPSMWGRAAGLHRSLAAPASVTDCRRLIFQCDGATFDDSQGLG